MSEQLSVFAKVEEAIIQQRSLLDGYSDGRKTRLILDEWGVWDKISKEDERRYGALWQQSTMRSAVAAGGGPDNFYPHAPKRFMCNNAQMVNMLQSLPLPPRPHGQ